MTKPMLLKSTNAKAISRSLNGDLQTRGIAAQVVILENCCHIILIAHQTLSPVTATAWIQEKLTEFNFPSIERFKIYGRQMGKKLPVWQQEFALNVNEDSEEGIACLVW